MGARVRSATIAGSGALHEDAGDWTAELMVESAAPQSPQNLSSGWFVAPHLGHVTTSGAPQVAQNLRPCLLSLSHFEQRMFPQ